MLQFSSISHQVSQGVCSHKHMQTRVTAACPEVGGLRERVGWGTSCCFISSCSRSHWHQQQEQRETKIYVSSDPSVSCHAEIGRATYLTLFLISGSFMWHYCFLALGLSSMARMLWGSFAAAQQMSQPGFILLCVCCRMLYTNSPGI